MRGRTVLSTVLLAVVVLSIVVGSALVLGVLDRPTVEATESRFADVNATTTVVETDLRVRNPSPVDVRLDGATVNHSVTMNGIEMGTGIKEGVAIGEGTTTLTLTTGIDNERIPEWWVTHVRNGERTRLDANATLRSSLLGRSVSVTETHTTETDITGAFNSSDPRPVNASLPLISDPILVVERSNATWGTVTREETALATEFVLANPKPLPFVVTRLDYVVRMNDVVVGNGTTGRSYAIPAQGQRTIRADATIENDRLDEWWVSHVERNQRTDLEVAFTAVLELPNGETVEIPLDGLEYTTDFETDVLDTKNESA